MLHSRRLSLFVLPFALLTAQGQSSSVLGDWREPGGSIIRIDSCGQDVCARLIAIGPSAPTQFDAQNPDPARRHDRLCGLQIGYGFRLAGPDHANNGHLYDPKSGKTYRGDMSAEGDALNLRGYIGVRAFGRSERWTRTAPPQTSCAP